MNAKKFAQTVLAVAAALFAAGASAAIVVTPGGSGGEVDNVLSNSCTGTITGGDAGALTVQGCLQDGTIIDFSSDEPLKITGGQSKITAADAGFTYMDISLNAASLTFDMIVLNLDSAENGFVTFFGTPGTSSAQVALTKGGQNRFTITGNDGEGFSSIFFQTTTSVITDLTQVRIAGVGTGITPTPNNNVPEPATLALLGAALLGVAASRKRKV